MHKSMYWFYIKKKKHAGHFIRNTYESHNDTYDWSHQTFEQVIMRFHCLCLRGDFWHQDDAKNNNTDMKLFVHTDTKLFVHDVHDIQGEMISQIITLYNPGEQKSSSQSSNFQTVKPQAFRLHQWGTLQSSRIVYDKHKHNKRVELYEAKTTRLIPKGIF